jgi:hypothetical protein
MTNVWKPRSLNKIVETNSLEDKISEINGLINKISDEKFDLVSGSILRIELFENTNEEITPEKVETMKRIVEIFINKMSIISLKFNKEGMIIPLTITNLFIKLKEQWSNGQGRLLASIMVKYIIDYFRDYTEKIKRSEEISSSERSKCSKIIFFTGLLFDKGLFDAKFCVFLLKEFMKPEEDNVTIFCYFMMSCHVKLCTVSGYKEKIVPNIKSYIKSCSENKELQTQTRFLCQDVTEII